MDETNERQSLEENEQNELNDMTMRQADYNISSESLLACSQQTSYSHFGDEDISPLILAFNPTQSSGEPGPPGSATSSDTSLGKRKASDMSSTSSVSTGPFRPSKLARSVVPAEEDNPFVDVPVQPENIFSPISISPARTLQRMFDVKKLPYGVQYEIARYVSMDRLEYKHFLVQWVDELASLKTNREAAPAMAKLVLKNSFEADEITESSDNFKKLFAKEHAAKSPWMELDREEEALSNNSYGGLGFNEEGEYLNWHGGQVLFHGQLHDTSAKGCKKPKFKLTLEPAELGPSNMFARRFGSKHFFRLKLTKAVLNKNVDDLMNYLRRPLILCGSVFRAFYAKDTNVFYVKTNESNDGVSIIDGKPIKGGQSFLEFLDWHNAMDLNKGQTMAKYVSRFALGLSNSVPGLMVDQSNIKFIDDILSKTDSNMTDGAGKINRWSLNQIRHRLEWEDKPTAIQTRIFGTKGLLVDDDRHAEQYAYVELTPSQRKIQFPSGTTIDPAHRIVDVLRSSHTKTPCRLSVETIINLAENGVGKQVFLELLHNSLAELVEPLLDWESPDAMRKLWTNVRRLGGVMAARRSREEAGLARVKGYSEREAEEIEPEDEDGFNAVDSTEKRSAAWWGDEISGCPSSLEETIMYMIDAGLTPQECPLLRDKLDKFIRTRVNNYIKAYRIDVPMSASAFLVPDTSGILEPGEVFFKSSRRQFQTRDGVETDIFVGDVLVTRHPCKLPTDIQKWKSVDKPGLHHLTDVIVCSTKGDRRAADLLSGGDYDGDKGVYIWQHELVAAFKNADLKYSEPPADIKTYFARENEEVHAFQTKTANISVENKIRQLQHYLLGAVRDTTVVGKYSTFHEIAIYTLGYSHPDTIRLAYMFCMTLDGIKTGMTVSKEVLKKDTIAFQKRPPTWKESEEDKARYDSTNEPNIQRPRHLPRFIMDELHKQASAESTQWNVRLDQHFKRGGSVKIDGDLAAPWQKAQELAQRWANQEKNKRMSSDLQKIQKHVEEMYNVHRMEMCSSPRKASRTSPKKDKLSFTNLPIEVRQDKIRDLSKRFASFPKPEDVLMPEEEIARVRASCAYVYDYEQKKHSSGFTRFPWDVGMRELCAIKARATGRSKTVAGDFYDHFNMKHPKNHHI
ncbi:RNA dependent RNA polymerase-domain-containing protein [Flammula alnicola]|nr:RNA dependent RNA polymerase-domain-containing protein [Flammula alnicola]